MEGIKKCVICSVIIFIVGLFGTAQVLAIDHTGKTFFTRANIW